MTEKTGIEDLLRRRLGEVHKEIERLRTELKPFEEEARSLERMIAEYRRGSMGSGDITDNQIVTWLNHNSHEDDRKSTAEIAAAFNADGRGFSKRLPRMARDKLIAGDPRGGYYVAVHVPSRRGRKAAASEKVAVSA